MNMIDYFVHRIVRNQLYEVLRDELPPAEKARAERHIAGCRRCSAMLEELRVTLSGLEELNGSPADNQPEEFWLNFSREVDARIDHAVVPARPTLREEYERFMTWLMGHQRWVLGMSSAVAVLVVALLLWDPLATKQPPPPGTAATFPTDTSSPVTALTPAATAPGGVVRARAADYFRRSKVLLVGLSNLKTDPREPVDLSAEQQLSRELAQEARFLRGQPLDLRSVRLLGDLEKVMTTVASAGAECDAPTFHNIQTGIHRSNLLFKIRMAESVYDTLR